VCVCVCVCVRLQDGVQNQVNVDPESQYIIRAGALELVTATRTSAGRKRWEFLW